MESIDIRREFFELEQEIYKLSKERANDIKKNYLEAYRKLRKKVEKIYADYEDDDGINISRESVRKLDKETALGIQGLMKRNTDSLHNTLNEVVNKAYETANKSCKKYNIEAVARKIDANNIIKKQVAGHIWTERIKKYGSDFVYDVHGIIHQGLDNGDTYTTTARKLKERFGKDIGNTMRIARTESARVLEDSKYQAFEDLANNESVQVFKIWHTMGDEAVRDTHDAMEGVKVAYDEDFILPSGAKCQYPKSTGVAAEDINCRCYVEYVTEPAPVELIVSTHEENKDMLGVYKEADIGKHGLTKAYEELIDEVGGIEYREVEELKKTLNDDEIVKKIAGGDETEGSCSSIAFAYIANKNGLDVTDYRGGSSRVVFSDMYNIAKLMELENVRGKAYETYTETKGAYYVLKNLDIDKEYYMAAGAHAAIVKRSADDIYYLELQDAKSNGWRSFKKQYGDIQYALSKRFGCKYSTRTEEEGPKNIITMEVDSFKENREFKDILGYINTATNEQKKGDRGNEK